MALKSQGKAAKAQLSNCINDKTPVACLSLPFGGKDLRSSAKTENRVVHDFKPFKSCQTTMKTAISSYNESIFGIAMQFSTHNVLNLMKYTNPSHALFFEFFVTMNEPMKQKVRSTGR